MSFWSGQKLKVSGDAQRIVEPFDEKQIDCSAYTLRMGREFYVTPGPGFDWRKNRKKTLRPAETVNILGVNLPRTGGSFVIPPGQFAFLLTEESVNIPLDAMGFISLKSRIKFRGLINVSGFHVDPGFQGHLIYSVFNAGPSPIHIARGDDLFLLWIATLDGDTNPDYTKQGKPPLAEIASSLVSDVARETHSLQALSDRIERLSNRVTVYTTIATAVSIIAGLFLAYLQVSRADNPAHEAVTTIAGATSTP